MVYLQKKIVEKVGFDGVWASGLSIATSLGVRDNNELSWKTIVDIVSYIASAIDIPVLVDGDTGFGDFNSARIFAKQLRQIGASGVCLEDKVFPKANSFLKWGQTLLDAQEFAGKIHACKDNVGNDFAVIARTEALIVGLGEEEALRRSYLYKEAGADALVIHSKQCDGQEVISFLQKWKNALPVILIPTKYPNVPVKIFEDLDVKMIIWANHNIRSSIKSMFEISEKILRDKSIANVLKDIASLEDIFALVNQNELYMDEQKYLKRS